MVSRIHRIVCAMLWPFLRAPRQRARPQRATLFHKGWPCTLNASNTEPPCSSTPASHHELYPARPTQAEPCSETSSPSGIFGHYLQQLQAAFSKESWVPSHLDTASGALRLAERNTG